jgi:hypothetical protein
MNIFLIIVGLWLLIGFITEIWLYYVVGRFPKGEIGFFIALCLFGPISTLIVFFTLYGKLKEREIEILEELEELDNPVFYGDQ